MSYVASFLFTNLNPDSAIQNLIFRSLRTKPILNCNLNDPPPHLDSSDWYPIWIQIFVPFDETAFRSQERARSSINTVCQAKIANTSPLSYAAEELKYIKFKSTCTFFSKKNCLNQIPDNFKLTSPSISRHYLKSYFLFQRLKTIRWYWEEDQSSTQLLYGSILIHIFVPASRKI